MSQTETFFLPDGRKTSDLKVNELKKELEKLGKSKSGNKPELLNRLNESFTRSVAEASEIEKENSVSSETQNELNNTNQDENEDISQNDHRTVKCKISRYNVDLDAVDDQIPLNAEVNQSVDALDLYVPIDDSLNITDESIQEERIQVTISRNEETETNDNGDDTRLVETLTTDKRTVICVSNDSENDKPTEIDTEAVTDATNENEPLTVEIEDKSQLVTAEPEPTENEPDEMENIELETQIEMYDVDNIDMDGQMEMYEEHKEEVTNTQDQKDENIIVNIEKDLRETEFLEVGTNEETEEGEVISVPITARLGKRKVKEESKSHSSPKKSKKKGLKETKGAGYIVEGPERIAPAQKPKNIASDVLRIDNLVRPFTLIQLQDMLALQGLVTDLWLNKIKSVAYVRYTTESVASSAQETIDGCRWPSINPKLLSCDFVSLREMEWMKEKGDTGTNPPSHIRQPTTQQDQKEPPAKPKDNKESIPSHQEQVATTDNEWRHQDKSKQTAGADNEWRHQDKPKQTAGTDNEWRHQDKPKQTSGADNEWRHQDKMKPSTREQPQNKFDRNDDAKRQRMKDHREALPDNNRRRQRSPQPDHRRHYDNQKEQKPRERNKEKSKEKNQPPPPPPPAAKLLEDIFRKTVTQPAIYWLPVANEKKQEPIKKIKEAVKVQ